MVHDFAAPNTREHLGLLGVALGGNDERDVPPNGLSRGPAEDAFRPAVPRRDHAIERFADDGIIGRVDDRGQIASLLVEPSALGDVARKAPGMNELVAAKQGIRVDEDLFDRSVLAPEPSFILVDRLVATEAVQDVGDGVLIDVEGCDVTTHVLLTVIAEQSELRGVRAKDDAVGANPMHRNGRILEQILEIRGGWLDLVHTTRGQCSADIASAGGVKMSRWVTIYPSVWSRLGPLVGR
jgi:hypothetical protein